MTVSKIPVDLTEQEERIISLGDLGLLGHNELKDFQDSVNSLLEVQLGWDGKSLRFKANSRVGAIELTGIRIQVRPKISANHFFTLLRYSSSVQTKPSKLRSSSEISWGMGFENALCAMLCDEVQEIFRIGLSRKYVEDQQPLEALRGKPIWQANFPWLGSKAREISCRFHRLSYDNLDNQLLLEGLTRAARLAHGETKTTAMQHISTLKDFARELTSSASDFSKAVQQYNRLNEHYSVAHGLCEMFVLGLRPASVFEKGTKRICGIVMDMADVFEKFVQRLAEDVLITKGFSLKAQGPDGGALLDCEDKTYTKVRPDLIVYRGSQPVAIIDAKYKTYWSAGPEGLRPTKKITNADIYQLFFYQQRLQRLHELARPPAAIIAAPLPAEEERGSAKIVPQRFQKVTWRASSERAGNVRLLLIPMTDFLRALEEGNSAMSALSMLNLDGTVMDSFGLN